MKKIRIASDEPKMTKRRFEICRAWDEIESVEPDISTEQLFARVSDRTGADEGDIATALYAKHLEEGATK